MASPQLKTRSWRPPFDADQTFVVARDFRLQGREFTTGGLFDRRLVTTRRLRQLYEQRFLRLAGAGEGGSAHHDEQASGTGTSPGAGVARRRRLSGAG